MNNEIKTLIINGKREPIDGKIYTFYKDKEQYLQTIILSKYISSHYMPSEYIGVDFNNLNSIILFLRNYGDIVLINQTNVINDIPEYKDLKKGLLLIPDVITDQQLDSYNKIKSELASYDMLDVWYDFKDYATSRVEKIVNKNSILPVVEDIINKQNERKKVR